MNKLHLAAALLAATLATPALAQNVQDKTEPQNAKDVTQASPPNQGATDQLKSSSGSTAQGRETGAVDQAQQHGKHHKKVMHHKKSSDGGSANSKQAQ